jgi:hypothetical protein
MDQCQLYSALLQLELPWKVNKVSLDPVKKVVEIYITHEKGSKLLCPICRKESMVYDHRKKKGHGGILTALNSWPSYMQTHQEYPVMNMATWRQ